MEFISCFSNSLSIVTINDEDDSVCASVVMSPQRSNLILSTNCIIIMLVKCLERVFVSLIIKQSLSSSTNFHQLTIGWVRREDEDDESVNEIQDTYRPKQWSSPSCTALSQHWNLKRGVRIWVSQIEQVYKPIVGIVVTFSSSFNLYKIVVLPIDVGKEEDVRTCNQEEDIVFVITYQQHQDQPSRYVPPYSWRACRTSQPMRFPCFLLLFFFTSNILGVISDVWAKDSTKIFLSQDSLSHDLRFFQRVHVTNIVTMT